MSQAELTATERFLTNRDTLAQLMYDHLTIDSSRALLDACKGKYINSMTAEEIYKMRVHLHNLFEPIADDSKTFIKFMISNNIVLVGRRAVGLMYPFVDVSESSWDFFGNDSDSVNELFNIMTDVKILKVDVTFEYIGSGMPVSIFHYTILKNEKKSLVRLITPRGNVQTTFWTRRVNAIEYILSLPCSADQCFFTGYVAISLYDSLTSRRMMIGWTANSLRRLKERMRDNIRKCGDHLIRAEDFFGTHLHDYANERVLAALNTQRRNFLMDVSTSYDRSTYAEKFRSSTRIPKVLDMHGGLDEAMNKKVVDMVTRFCKCIELDEDADNTIASLEFYIDKGFKFADPGQIQKDRFISDDVKKLFVSLDISGLATMPRIFPSFRSVQSGGMSRVISLSDLLPTEMTPIILPRIERLFSITWCELIALPHEDESSHYCNDIYTGLYGPGYREIEWSSMQHTAMKDMVLRLVETIAKPSPSDSYESISDIVLEEVSSRCGNLYTPFGI